MSNKTQINWVRSVLTRKGKIDRNLCIRTMYITRLSDIIFKLKKEGMKIKGERLETKLGSNYQYVLE